MNCVQTSDMRKPFSGYSVRIVQNVPLVYLGLREKIVPHEFTLFCSLLLIDGDEDSVISMHFDESSSQTLDHNVII